MIKSLLIFIFILISSLANAKVDGSAPSLPFSNNNTTVWKRYVVSERIDPQGQDVAEYSINEVFKGREIVIDDKNVTVEGVCKYEYHKEEMTPLQYWGSQKTVELYNIFLSGYNVELNNTLELITPVNPSIECIYPFSYFIKIDGSLVFVLKNRAVIYSQLSEGDKVSNAECVHKEQTIEQVYENGDIVDCYYKNMSVLESYSKYRNELASSDRENLQGEIVFGKNFSMKCNNVCILIEYKWSGPGNLIVTQQFDGGEKNIFQ